MHELEFQNNRYLLNRKKRFKPNVDIGMSNKKEAFNFAYAMTFEQIGEHRDHRTGGGHKRSKGEIFTNVYQGKLAEFAFYNYYYNKVNNISKPDLSVMGLNKWDLYDFKINDKKIAVKSTKSKGNLVLLEKDDWDENGCYIPNRMKRDNLFDYFVLVRVEPDFERIMRDHNIFKSNEVNKNELFQIITKAFVRIEITGYFTHQEFVSEIIHKGQIIHKGYLLGRNGKKMDAENYYIQSGDLHSPEELVRDTLI